MAHSNSKKQPNISTFSSNLITGAKAPAIERKGANEAPIFQKENGRF